MLKENVMKKWKMLAGLAILGLGAGAVLSACEKSAKTDFYLPFSLIFKEEIDGISV